MVQYDGSMPEEITIDASGRLVIPKDVRARHRLNPGARLLLLEEEDRLVLVPRATETSTVERAGILVFRGALSGPVPDHRHLRDERLDQLAGRR
jgi:AbrB family looped-hinge helix DNA binding protein